MHPLRTILLLALAQIIGAPPPPQTVGAPPPPQAVSPPPPALHSLPSAIRWTVEISASPVASPIVEGDHVFIVLQSGVVSARKVTDGTPAWEVSLRSKQPLALEGGRLYVATDDEIVAVNASDGAKVWSVKTAPLTAPLVAQGGWVITATEKALTAFRSVDGTQVWTREFTGAQVMPTLEGDNLYLPLEDGRLFALDLRTGADRWVKSFVGPLSEVLAFPDRVLFGTRDKFFFCLRSSDGELDWQRVRLGSIVRGRPAADDERVYVLSIDNSLRAFRRTNGALLWHPSVPYRPTTGPVVIDSAVLVAGNASELKAFAGANGQPVGQITLPESLVMAPAFGKSGSETLMSGFTGTIEGPVKLVLTGPPAPAAPHE